MNPLNPSSPELAPRTGKKRSKSNSQFSPEIWVAEGLEVLRRSGGVGGVKVETVARRLGMTKRSFYWQFSDHEELLRAMHE